MHDPMVVAHEIRRPWPQRDPLHDATKRAPRRWRFRLKHEHWDDGPLPSGAPDNCGCKRNRHGVQRNPFPWWRPRSYSCFWTVAGRGIYWPPLITIWHVEPGGHDGLSVCSRRYRDKHGQWHYTRSWRWHVHHWKLQVIPLQNLRRWALTRCAVCGGKSRRHHRINISGAVERRRTRWWQGESGLSHMDCYDKLMETRRGQ